MMDEENFSLLKDTIYRTMGFDCNNYSDTFLSRRIAIRLRALDIETYKEYATYLSMNDKEQDALNHELTVHVTNFFRDQSMWTYFMKEVGPAIVKSRTSKIIDVWCAGCSSGEEPYSYAICFCEFLGEKLKDYTVRIRGTDLEPDVIAKARAGFYSANQFQEMPEKLRDKYFEKVSEDQYKVKEKIMKMCRFDIGDILHPMGVKADLISCRNTVIYFSNEAKNKLYLEFYLNTKQKGFLILGKTEILQGPARERFTIFNLKERVYTRNSM